MKGMGMIVTLINYENGNSSTCFWTDKIVPAKRKFNPELIVTGHNETTVDIYCGF